MPKINKPLILLALLTSNMSALGDQGYMTYESSPYNYENSEFNYENSPNNFNNSPYNYENSPYNYGSERVIRDNDGNVRGYAVPKSGGGSNIFDTEGNRLGYTPAK